MTLHSAMQCSAVQNSIYVNGSLVLVCFHNWSESDLGISSCKMEFGDCCFEPK